MRAYGIPRLLDAEIPDKADIKYFGFSTTDRCSRADRGKNKARLIWRKKARARAKIEIQRALRYIDGRKNSQKKTCKKKKVV